MPELAVTKKDTKGELQNFLGSRDMLDSFRTVLPKFLTPERLVKAAMVAASRTPKLYECTKLSLAQSLMRAAELGLDPSGTLGQGYLIPFYNSKINQTECQFITGYQGLIELCRRTGELASIEARCVHEGDVFEREYGLENKLRHIPSLDCDDKPILCAYAIAVLKDGSRQVEVMSKKQIDGIRARSKAKDSGPWVTDYEEMARKTVIRRLVKYLPKSVDIIRAIEQEEETEYADKNIKAVASSVVENLKPIVKSQPQPEPEQPANPETEPKPIGEVVSEAIPQPPAETKKEPTDEDRRVELFEIIDKTIGQGYYFGRDDEGVIQCYKSDESDTKSDLMEQSVVALSMFKSTKEGQEGKWVPGATSVDLLKGKRLEITLRTAREVYAKANKE